MNRRLIFLTWACATCCFVGSGCGGKVNSYDRSVCQYRWSGAVTNVAGCAAAENSPNPPFLIPMVEVLRSNGRQLIVVIQTENPPMGVLMAFEQVGQNWHPKEVSGSTANRSLSAWLIRYTPKAFDAYGKMENVFHTVQSSELLDIADGKVANSDGDVVGFLMEGTGSVETRMGMMVNVRLKLDSVDPIPMYRAYVEATLRLDDEMSAVISSNTEVKEEIRSLRQCLDHTPKAERVQMRGILRAVREKIDRSPPL